MRCLIIGSGGREHALAWKLRQNPQLGKLFIAPGNAGTAAEGENVPIAVDNIEALVTFAREKSIDLVIPGPELPLTLGIVDAMQAAGIACFGPTKWCAQLEGSKAFAKEIMQKAGVPTAPSATFTTYAAAKAFVDAQGVPIVIKADGLAAGKGVTVAQTLDEAYVALHETLVDNTFGSAGAMVLIEQYLAGEEVSLLAFCDGETALPLPSAQDHKAAFDGDTGPNTGGMGAYSPAPILPDSELERMTDIAIRPILRVMKEAGHPFTGILYAGLMMTNTGPMVLEYNTRFGDPECQPQLMRLENDLIDIFTHCLAKTLHTRHLDIREEAALGVVLAAGGYPQEYMKGATIQGLDAANALPDTKVFEAGVKQNGVTKHVDGGRVLCVTSLGKDLAKAKERAYHAVGMIQFDNMQFRTDIGAKGIQSLQSS